MSSFTPSLHGLRALAAIGVILFHWNSLFPALNKATPGFTIGSATWSVFTPIHFGWLGVPLFFVLSGYLLGGQLKDKSLNRQTLQRFWTRRFLRIYPAVWFQGIILLLASQTFTTISYHPSTAELFRNAILWVNMPPWMTKPLNGVWWTLPIELTFYVALPMLIVSQRKLGWLTVYLACVTGSIIWRAWIIASNPSTNYVPLLPWLDMLPGSLSSFAAGFAASFLRINNTQTNRRLLLAAGTIGLLALMQLLLINLDTYWQGSFLLMLWNSLAAFMLALILISQTMPTSDNRWRPLSSRPLVWLGEISFGLYLWHFPIQKLVSQSDMLDWSSPAGSLYALLVCTALTIPCAAASFYLIERPIMGWSKQRVFYANKNATQ
ncbi:acyltransferase [Gilvimarinus sp. DA14]|uniref:acyltransferase family protein n=1 Tax=Gilvimarinus sp. DA14 TaxID=2956798 RepID=UPI0020B8EDEA|nr:acyltransferase [Gilvimarinus sp. DA14]UTF59823.1 acyltransferase [Gilvimarinus sp. DA14]